MSNEEDESCSSSSSCDLSDNEEMDGQLEGSGAKGESSLLAEAGQSTSGKRRSSSAMRGGPVKRRKACQNRDASRPQDGEDWRRNHNAQERRRRDNLGEEFKSLACCLGLPATASRFVILEKTAVMLKATEKAEKLGRLYERTKAQADADKANGLTDSPAIRKLATIPFMDVVLPVILRSLGIKPKKNPEDNLVYLSMFDDHDRLLKEAKEKCSKMPSTSVTRPECVATCSALAPYRSACLAPSDTQDEGPSKGPDQEDDGEGSDELDEDSDELDEEDYLDDEQDEQEELTDEEDGVDEEEDVDNEELDEQDDNLTDNEDVEEQDEDEEPDFVVTAPNPMLTAAADLRPGEEYLTTMEERVEYFMPLTSGMKSDAEEEEDDEFGVTEEHEMVGGVDLGDELS